MLLLGSIPFSTSSLGASCHPRPFPHYSLGQHQHCLVEEFFKDPARKALTRSSLSTCGKKGPISVKSAGPRMNLTLFLKTTKTRGVVTLTAETLDSHTSPHLSKMPYAQCLRNLLRSCLNHMECTGLGQAGLALLPPCLALHEPCGTIVRGRTFLTLPASACRHGSE